MGMKNRMNIITGLALAIFLIAGTGYGQEAVRVVEGYKIDPSKTAKPTRATKAGRAVSVTGVARPAESLEPLSVAGFPVGTLAPTSAEAVTVTGFALPDNEKVSTQRKATLTFKGESKPSEVKVKVTEEEGYLKIMVHSSFESGSVSVELIDPKGENRGKYTLKTDDLIVTGDKTTVREEVTGDMQKDFVDPLKGEWIIRAIPVAAEGKIDVMILQEAFPGLIKGVPAQSLDEFAPKKR